MPDTRRSLSALQTLLADNVIGDISAQDVRDFLVSAYRVVQVVNTMSSGVQTGSTVIPLDDTIPQNTEGFEVMTLAITPFDTNNKLQIDVCVTLSCASAYWGIVALFQDSTASALAAVAQYQNIGTGMLNFKFTHYMTAGTTSSTTFKVRIGPESSRTMTFNGASSARYFGGVMASSITIHEIIP